MSTDRKVLVADDSLTIRKLVEAVLTQAGYEVTTVANGADCLTQAAAQKPALILLDYILPDMQGTEVCRQLINSPDTWEIPVLMMSSNGNAIRQLYQDLNNVADYLTKPFAPNVLEAVVGHLLKREKSTGESATSSTSSEAPPAPAEASVPKDLMEKMDRLLNLVGDGLSRSEVVQQLGIAPAADGVTAPTPAPAKPARKRRPRKAATAVPAHNSVLRKFRLALQKHLRLRAAQIPDWEAARGTEAPEEFFLSRLLAKEVISDLSVDLVRATGVAQTAAGVLRCPSSLIALDAVLRHLHSTHATGELHVETAEETVVACLEGGRVVFLTTNHPRNYCGGAACDFQAVSHDVIGSAVREQEERSIPFFVTLQEEGQLPPSSTLEELLAAQGEKCLIRGFKARDAVVTFHPLVRLPALARAHKLDVPLNRLLLLCYRTVDDWFSLEQVLPEMEGVIVPMPELVAETAELKLESDESLVLERIGQGRTLAELATAAQMPAFEVCRIVFRFIRLGLLSSKQNHSAAEPRNNASCTNATLSAGDLPPVTPLPVLATETVTCTSTAEKATGSDPEPGGQSDSGNPEILLPPLIEEQSAAPAPDHAVIVNSPASARLFETDRACVSAAEPAIQSV